MSVKHPLQKYDVTDANGVIKTIEANYVFENDGFLVFRKGDPGETDVVAGFAPGGWHHYLLAVK